MKQRFDRWRPVLVLALVVWATVTGLVAAAGARQEGYPPPTSDASGVVATPLAYPPADLLPVPIGGQPGVEPAQGIVTGASGLVGEAAAPIAQQAVGQGLLYLWLGFIATLLIFGTCVVGAAMLFTRRNEP